MKPKKRERSDRVVSHNRLPIEPVSWSNLFSAPLQSEMKQPFASNKRSTASKAVMRSSFTTKSTDFTSTIKYKDSFEVEPSAYAKMVSQQQDLVATSLSTSNNRHHVSLPKMRDYLHKNPPSSSEDSSSNHKTRKHSTPDSYDSKATDDYDDQSMKDVTSMLDPVLLPIDSNSTPAPDTLTTTTIADAGGGTVKTTNNKNAKKSLKPIPEIYKKFASAHRPTKRIDSPGVPVERWLNGFPAELDQTKNKYKFIPTQMRTQPIHLPNHTNKGIKLSSISPTEYRRPKSSKRQSSYAPTPQQRASTVYETPTFYHESSRDISAHVERSSTDSPFRSRLLKDRTTPSLPFTQHSVPLL